MRIYTRGGDKGKTGIRGGQRVDKDDIRIEANGTLDELNSMIGIVRSFLPHDHAWHELLFKIQSELMVVMSQVATPSALRSTNPNKVDEGIVEYLENEIDQLTDEMGESEYFILPGGTLVSSHLQMARAIVRRAERRIWSLHKLDEVPEIILRFLNRLSDFFFTLARYEMFISGNPEEKWKLFLYRKK